MAGRFLTLNATTQAGRIAVTAAAKDAITAAGGWITGSTAFSNVSLCLNFEIEAALVSRLADTLRSTAAAGAPLTLSEASLAALRETDRAGELTGTLQITFIHDEPDLRVPVPAIPG